MRLAIPFLLIFAAGIFGQDEKKTTRHGVTLDLETYSQESSKEALASVLKAIEKKKIDYLLAQLADPDWVDKRLEMMGGKFEDLVKETSAKLAADPTIAKDLGRFLREGEWEMGDATASAKLKDLAERRVFMKKVENRWYLENRQKGGGEK